MKISKTIFSTILMLFMLVFNSGAFNGPAVPVVPSSTITKSYYITGREVVGVGTTHFYYVVCLETETDADGVSSTRRYSPSPSECQWTVPSGFSASYVQWLACIQLTAPSSPSSSTTLQVNVNGIASAPKQITAIVVNPIVNLRSIQFTSDHDVICDGSYNDPTDTGSRYPTIEWQSDPVVNAPMTHTAGERIELSIKFDVSGVADFTPFTLTGTSTEDAYEFTSSGSVSQGLVTMYLTASNPIDEIGRLGAMIEWTLTVAGKTFVFNTGNHIMYTTYGTPKSSNSASVPTGKRCMLAYDLIQAMDGYDVVENIEAAICVFMGKLSDGFDLEENWDGEEVWNIATGEGGDCISIAELMCAIADMMGLPGSFQVVIYGALYNTTEEVDRAEHAIGNIDLNCGIHPGDYDPVLVQGTSDSDYLFFKDEPGNPNSFQAAVVYTDSSDVTLYYPAGVGQFIYDNPDGVIHLFESLSWWACVDHDDNDLTPMILEENVADHYYEPLDEAF